eukprot:TRINITY_DN2704_c1_g1_i4.p1 TRINITY_DN2704_c1_g1~~TRINITY_DN2704_c1_g1_i4.p1  ORF type:complete len:662 (-),score=158.98 TRINITY_DN2704_c1_g1_i4:131-2116(-)
MKPQDDPPIHAEPAHSSAQQHEPALADTWRYSWEQVKQYSLGIAGICDTILSDERVPLQNLGHASDAMDSSLQMLLTIDSSVRSATNGESILNQYVRQVTPPVSMLSLEQASGISALPQRRLSYGGSSSLHSLLPHPSPPISGLSSKPPAGQPASAPVPVTSSSPSSTSYQTSQPRSSSSSFVGSPPLSAVSSVSSNVPYGAPPPPLNLAARQQKTNQLIQSVARLIQPYTMLYPSSTSHTTPTPDITSYPAQGFVPPYLSSPALTAASTPMSLTQPTPMGEPPSMPYPPLTPSFAAQHPPTPFQTSSFMVAPSMTEPGLVPVGFSESYPPAGMPSFPGQEPPPQREFTIVPESGSQSFKRKRRSRAPAPILDGLFCHSCGETQTSQWRRGPDGCKSLCNACGIRFANMVNREKTVPMKETHFSVGMLLNERTPSPESEPPDIEGASSSSTFSSPSSSTSSSTLSADTPLNITPTSLLSASALTGASFMTASVGVMTRGRGRGRPSLTSSLGVTDSTRPPTATTLTDSPQPVEHTDTGGKRSKHNSPSPTPHHHHSHSLPSSSAGSGYPISPLLSLTLKERAAEEALSRFASLASPSPSSPADPQQHGRYIDELLPSSPGSSSLSSSSSSLSSSSSSASSTSVSPITPHHESVFSPSSSQR